MHELPSRATESPFDEEFINRLKARKNLVLMLVFSQETPTSEQWEASLEPDFVAEAEFAETWFPVITQLFRREEIDCLIFDYYDMTQLFDLNITPSSSLSAISRSLFTTQ